MQPLTEVLCIMGGCYASINIEPPAEVQNQKQRTTHYKQQTTNNKPQTTNNKPQTSIPFRLVIFCL